MSIINKNRMKLRAAQTADLPDAGALRVTALSEENMPLQDAVVDIPFTGDPEEILEEVRTDQNGQTEQIRLAALPVEYSLEPSEFQPYAEYTIRISAPGYEPLTVSGAEVFSGQLSLQNVKLRQNAPDTIVIPANTLYGYYPPKIAEAEVKPVNVSGEIVLDQVVVPEYIVVHDGTPQDSSVGDYYVQYKDYIKNVASSEIYSTWPYETLIANILAIQSFTLNRVYTEWYRNIR